MDRLTLERPYQSDMTAPAPQSSVADFGGYTVYIEGRIADYLIRSSKQIQKQIRNVCALKKRVVKTLRNQISLQSISRKARAAANLLSYTTAFTLTAVVSYHSLPLLLAEFFLNPFSAPSVLGASVIITFSYISSPQIPMLLTDIQEKWRDIIGADQIIGGANGAHAAHAQESASKVARRLERNYGSFLNGSLNNIQNAEELQKKYPGLFPTLKNGSSLDRQYFVNSLHEWVNCLYAPPHCQDKEKRQFMNETAKRFVNYFFPNAYFDWVDIRAASRRTYQDKGSNINISDLFLLCFIAAHDLDKKVWPDECSINARQNDERPDLYQLVQAMYHSMREYNLDINEKDNMGDDSPACATGIFNTLTQSLQGIHQDFEEERACKDMATAKFQALVRHYTKMLDPNIIEMDQGIWNLIKDQVEADLSDEYRALFPNGTDDKGLKDITDNWEYVGLEEAGN